MLLRFVFLVCTIDRQGNTRFCRALYARHSMLGINTPIRRQVPWPYASMTCGPFLVCRWYLSIRAVPGHSMCHLGITNIPCSKHAKTGGAAPAVRRSRYRISASSDRCEVKIVGRLFAALVRRGQKSTARRRSGVGPSDHDTSSLFYMVCPPMSRARTAKTEFPGIHRKYRLLRHDLVLPQEVFSAIISR